LNYKLVRQACVMVQPPASAACTSSSYSSNTCICGACVTTGV
jgi:hypothetical protein